MAQARAHVLVTGYVQGVFFRHTMSQKARARGLAGWVTNRPDGRVEAVIQGEEADVRALVDWCRSGPPHATVEQVEVSWEEPDSALAGFNVV